MKLEDLQPDILAAVKTAPSFAGKLEHIYADDGTIKAKCEESLSGETGVGWCVVVSPPLGGSGAKDGFGLGQIPVLTVVSIRTNPKKNKGVGALNVLKALRETINALLSKQPTPGEVRYKLTGEEPFAPDFEDVGCYTFDIRVLKICSF